MSIVNLIIKPDEEEPEAAEVYVDGAVGGHPYRFLLDTGAGRSSIQFDDYTASFPSVEQHLSLGVFAPSSEDLITVPNIEIGPIARQNVTLTRNAANAAHVKSLIGMDILREYRCHFNFKTNQLAVNDDIERTEDDRFHALTVDTKYHPYINIEYGTMTAHAVWDSGASITVVNRAFIQNNPTFFQPAGTSIGIDSTGASVETPMFVMSGARIGGQVFPPHGVACVDLSAVNSTIEIPMDLIVGYSTWSNVNWLFDFPGKRWAISTRL